jgi:hypothetical protein
MSEVCFDLSSPPSFLTLSPESLSSSSVTVSCAVAIPGIVKTRPIAR